jgi:uncharacterized damage-inducible protein DinB
METGRPEAGEYAPYYDRYVRLVPEGPIAEVLAGEVERTLQLLGELGEARAGHRYQPDKWSVREVVAHLIDTERLFAYRMLSFARNDPAELPGMDENQWAREARAERRTLADLGGELSHLRRSHVAMVGAVDDEVGLRRGTANGVRFTVRAMPFIIAGHEIHHRRVLAERYR